jgi:hypothetical protein
MRHRLRNALGTSDRCDAPCATNLEPRTVSFASGLIRGIIVNIRAAIPDQMFEMLMEGNDLTLRDWFMDVSIKKCDPRASRVKMPKPTHVSELA